MNIGADMNIFFYTTAQSAEEKKVSKRIAKILKDSGAPPISNLFVKERHVDLKNYFFDGLDGLIVEATNADSTVGYMIASALSRKIPILLLLKKGSEMDQYLQGLLLQVKSSKNAIDIKYYNENNVEKHLYAFMDRVGADIEKRGVPSIKFTLRITPYIDHYLNWKASKENMTKANFLRDKIVDEIIGNDEDFQQYLDAQKKV